MKDWRLVSFDGYDVVVDRARWWNTAPVQFCDFSSKLVLYMIILGLLSVRAVGDTLNCLSRRWVIPWSWNWRASLEAVPRVSSAGRGGTAQNGSHDLRLISPLLRLLACHLLQKFSQHVSPYAKVLRLSQVSTYFLMSKPACAGYCLSSAGSQISTSSCLCWASECSPKCLILYCQMSRGGLHIKC